MGVECSLRVSNCLHSVWLCSTVFCNSVILVSISFISESDTSGKLAYKDEVQTLLYIVDQYLSPALASADDCYYSVLIKGVSSFRGTYSSLWSWDHVPIVYSTKCTYSFVYMYLICNIDFLFAIHLFLEFSISHQLIQCSLDTLQWRRRKRTSIW